MKQAEIEKRLDKLQQSLDKIVMLLERRFYTTTVLETSTGQTPPKDPPDENGRFFGGKFSCKHCGAECMWEWFPKKQSWYPVDPTMPFPRHNCAKRKAQDTADVCPGR